MQLNSADYGCYGSYGIRVVPLDLSVPAAMVAMAAMPYEGLRLLPGSESRAFPTLGFF